MGGGDRAGPQPAERIQQGAMPARIEQAPLVMLAVDLDQARADVAQQRRRAGLVIEKGAAAAVGLERAANDEGLARFGGDVVFGEQRRQRGSGRWRIECCRDARLIGATAHQAAVRPRAERQPQRIEENRFARAGLAGEHGQPALERQIERLDEDDVSDGKAGQHDRARP